MAGAAVLAQQRSPDEQERGQRGEDQSHRGENQLALSRVEIHRHRYFRRRSGRSQNGAGPAGSSAWAPLPDGAEPPPRNTAGGAAWDAGVARGAAGGAGLRAGGAARGWAGGGWGGGGAPGGPPTRAAGGGGAAPGWPFPRCPPSGPGALDRVLDASPLGWPGVAGRPVRDWDGTSGPFVPVRAQPDGGRAAGSSVRGGRSSGGGVRPGAPFTPPLARPIATAPAPGLAPGAGGVRPPPPASASPAAPGGPGAAAP